MRAHEGSGTTNQRLANRREQLEAEMGSDTRVIRRGAWTLPVAGLLLGAPWLRPWFAESADLSGKGMTWWLGPIKLGVVGSAPTDTAAWARITASDGYQLFSGTQVLGLLSLLFGLFVLYGYLAGGRSPRWARAAVTLGIAGIVPAMMLLGALAFAEPRVVRLYQNGIDVCSTSVPPGALCRWYWGPMPWISGDPLEGGGLFLTFLTLVVASMIAFGVAIWQSSLLPKWVALAFAAAYFGCIAITPVLTLVGGLLMIVAGGWITLQLNREAVGRISSPDALPTAIRT
jgi:hypothetical protein